MPINPAIALGVKGIELQDPLAQYGRVAQIQNYQQANQLNQLKMQEAQQGADSRNALNKAYSSALNPETGEVNLNQLRSSLATGGYGSQIPAVEKGILEMQDARAGLRKNQIALVKDKLDAVKPLYQQALASQNPGAAMLEIHSAVHADPDLGPWLQSMGATAERGQQDIMAAITQGPQAVQQKILTSLASVDKLLPSLVSTETGGGTEMGVRNQLTGAYTPTNTVNKTPLPADVVNQKTAIASAGAIKLPGQKFESAYETAGGKATFDRDDELVSTMEQSPQLVAKLDKVLDVLRNQDINTGLGADVFNVLDKARSQFAADKSAGKRVTSTEYLDALLGSDVFPQIQALGIGARGMDTPAEREFLRKVMTGTISLNKDTLIKMTELRRNALETAANRYNKRVDAGELDRYFTTTGRTKFRAEVPNSPTAAPASDSTAGRPAGVGANWSFMTDAKGNKAWVSPDNKSFVEVK